MLGALFGKADERSVEEQKKVALGYLMEASEEARHDGLEETIIANAALFLALTHFVEIYGEEAVSDYVARIGERVKQGEYTINRITQ